MKSDHSPCVLLKYTPNMPENHLHVSNEPHVEVGKIGRKKKKRISWKLLHRKTGKYDLVQAAKDYQYEAEVNQKVSCQPTETPVGPDEVTEGRKVKKGFWKWPVFHRKTRTYDLVQATKDHHEAMLNQKVSSQPIETPVGLDEVAEERKEKRGFWKWPDFLCKSRTYDLVQATKDYHEAMLKQKVSCQPIETTIGPDEVPEARKEKKGFWKRLTHLFTSKSSRASALEDHVPAAEQLEEDVTENDIILRQYKIGDKLGKGGFGSVYKATRRRDGLEVAVKYTVKSPMMKEMKVPGYVKPLPTEIALAIMANNGPYVPEIIKLIDWEDNDDHYIIIMERPTPCMDLLRFLNHKNKPLDEKMGRHIMWQAIHAASVCFDRGVFHRDIKLENLLVNPDTLEVKLIDFGCGSTVKRSGYKVFCGTREYFPPEYEMYGRYHAQPATVWSLGIVLFAMMCGALPSISDHSLIRNYRWTSPDLSKECCRMICGCLQPDPDERLALQQMHLHNWFKVME
ncbi:serine/threonine-protein kinase pim-2 isoform X1 [Danio rerio]|uniref:non-specific serine/threonine protein kinase n=2 Tax=Danio rerio TaxID=7955 RepID=A0A8M6Z299_DANRE|nr:serine/threonine-protein kinase pim-2 [Danio rerio]|eukprot:XP_017207211.2 serine/threonine-protein kinase pim-2 [Danio rerio]